MTSDEPGSPTPDGPSGPARRSRRAGRTSQSYDFRARFGEPQPTERREGLREPARREIPVRGRGRVTVRELMEQMGVQNAPATPPPPAQNPPRAQAPVPPRPATPTGPPAPPAALPAQPPVPTRPPVPAPPADITQMLPPVAETTGPVDLSAAATAERAQRESRSQAPRTPAEQTSPAPDHPQPAAPEQPAKAPSAPAPGDTAAATAAPQPPSAEHAARERRPLEPTPDLTGAIEQVQLDRRRPRRTGRSFSVAAARNTGRVLVALACVLTLVGTGYVWNALAIDSKWNTTAAINANDPNIRNKGAQTGDENYLIVGTDSRAGVNGKIGGGDSTTIEGIRSDTILLVNIPADRSRVVAVSWPRDLQVDRPECEQWDANTGTYPDDPSTGKPVVVPAESDVKLNSIYAIGGPSCLVKTLTKISGLYINHFIGMDFEGFEKVVNVIGGVKVCSTVPLYDYELGYILRKPGTQKLTGKRALNYVRARNISVEGNGDYGRIKRQQLFMSSLLRSTLSSDVMSNPTKLKKILNTFIKYSTVDNVNIDSLVQLADSMQGVDAGRVTFVTIPTSGTAQDGSNNEIPRMDDIHAIFNAIIDDKPLPGEKKQKPKKGETTAPKSSSEKPAPTPSQVDATAQYPTNMTVRVLNGSGQTGVATEVMNVLIREGFTVPGVADASTEESDTVVRYGAGEQDSAATIAKMFPGAKIQEDRTVKVGVEVILGTDFQGTSAIADPPSPGNTLSVGQLPPANTNSDLPNDLSVTNAGDTTCS
ncbi:LCP family protein [Gordonia sp. PP30]|uniref:LCP family protein n=1 Tax=Gordonia sp. PP30 TaxID=2935861 RepID=UPI001FFE6724|nr:LCP family protein [Gordonia sp. PP30]UQE75736.1 LCP family protein [Gordonia sp. PP30]